MYTFRMPFLAAHWAIGADTCGSVIDTLTMNGDLVVTTQDAAFMTAIGIFGSVATSAPVAPGAAAIAPGVKAKPARKSTLSRVTSSLARRLAVSGFGPPLSRT